MSARTVITHLKGDIVPTILFAGLLIAALVHLDEVRSWFSLADPTSTEARPATAPSSAPETVDALPSFAFPDASLQALRGAFDDYEVVRAKLANDDVAQLAQRGHGIAEWIRRASASAGSAPESITDRLLAAGAAAERLAAASDVEAARTAFGQLSDALVALATADARLQQGWHIFECPMATGYGKWLQRSDDLANPYMGQDMLTCGSPSDFAATEAPDTGGISHDGHGHAGDDVSFHTCSMHPSVREQEPGACPICGMDLTPVTFDEEEGGVIFVDEPRRQRIGVRIGEVTRGPMRKEIRSVGKLTYDETKLVDVTLKYKGWIQGLYANAVGMRVKRGQALFSVYSPEIYAAQGDLLTALSGPSLDFGDGASNRPDPLVAMARQRLALLDAYGLDRHLERTGKPVRAITVVAPKSGYVVEKNVVEGSAVEAGKRILRIAGLDTVWIEAELYEHELPLVSVGSKVTVTLSYVPGKRYVGEVTFVYPFLDGKSRTGRARIELDNAELELKPDMYANVRIDVDLGERLRVPESAVIYTGPRRLVFVDLGEGRLRPKVVTLGLRTADHYEVLSGLRAGDRVVTSGNFLVAAESRIRSAALYWNTTGDAADDSGDKAPGGEP